MARAVLLDIEGTTSPIAFVYEVLFPYAEERLHDFVVERFEEPEMRETIAKLFEEYQHEQDAAPAWFSKEDMEGAASYLQWLMEKDRKSTALKTIQGRIWQQGFESGELKAEFFDDVHPALARWNETGVGVYIFSSGSVLAQRLLFQHSQNGDLSPLIQGHFDTETGPKRQLSSYLKIAEAIGVEPGEILFLSDVSEELMAAHEAGMDVRLVIRPGNKPTDSRGFNTVSEFSDL